MCVLRRGWLNAQHGIPRGCGEDYEENTYSSKGASSILAVQCYNSRLGIRCCDKVFE